VTELSKTPVDPVREFIAANLVRARSERGLSQEALALKSGLHRTFITHVEGKRRNLSVESLAKIAWALEIPSASLLLSPGASVVLPATKGRSAKS
jgi:transcriptional regulator with XRE-family HTH domain